MSWNIEDDGVKFTVRLSNGDTLKIDKRFVEKGELRKLTEKLEELAEDNWHSSDCFKGWH